MTKKQELFCLEYLKDLNATQAAIRAGYSEETAAIIGWENLRKPNIRQQIDAALDELMNESKTMLKTRLVSELRDIAFGDTGIELLRDKDGKVYDIKITDKLKAMDMLGKYLAIWTERKEVALSNETYEKLKTLYDGTD